MSTNNSMVTHNWIHGKASKGSNLRGDGRFLVSYSTAIAYNTERGLVFLSSDNMTSSTSKHISYAYRAARHLDIISTPLFTFGNRYHWQNSFDEVAAFQKTCDMVNDTINELNAARLSKHLFNRIERVEGRADELKALGKKYTLGKVKFNKIDAAQKERARVYHEQTAERERAADEKRRADEIKRLIARRDIDRPTFERWLLGEAVQCPSSFRYDDNGGAFLTCRGDMVITSQGAQAPLAHVKKALEFYASRIISAPPAAIFEPWQKNGHRVPLGTFTLDSIDAQGTARAGCHKFFYTEIARFMATL